MNTDITDEDLLGWAEGRLDEAREARLREAMGRDPELAATLGALEASRLPYARALAAPPMPEALRAALGERVRRAHDGPTPASARASTHVPANDPDNGHGGGPGDRPRDRSRGAGVGERAGPTPAAGFRGPPDGGSNVVALPAGRRAAPRLAAAACLVASFAAGHVLTSSGALDAAGRTLAGLVPGTGETPRATPDLIAADALWVERVADYQSLYVPETVGDAGGLEAGRRTLERIARETGLATGIPDLSAFGYAFARAQRLGYEGDPLVQLVYTAPGKLPLALCHMPRDGADAPLVTAERSGLATASWAAAGQRFVLVGEESPERLEGLQAAARTTWL